MSANSQLPASGPWIFRDDVRPDDRARVRALVESTAVFNPAEVAVAVELVEERLAKGPSSGYEFVFAEPAAGSAAPRRAPERHGAGALGYTCYGHIAATAGSYDLYWIAVDKSCQGLGLGKALLERSEELIRRRGGTRVYIETSGRHAYAPTRAFYLRCGYTQDAVLRDFYAPGDDKVIYVKAL